MNEKVIKEIVKTRNAIRRKFQALKTGRMETETQLEETFKPITKPLKELVTSAKREPTKFLKTELKEQNDADEMMTPPRKVLKREPMYSSSYLETDDDDDGVDEFATPTLKRAASMDDILPTNNLISEYMTLYINKSSKIDKSYGVYFDGNDWKIGNSKFKIDGDEVIIKGKKYSTTPGLLELLFLINPNKKNYTSDDLSNYELILRDTNAYKRDYKDDGQINGNRSKKYVNIIKKFIIAAGKGLMQIPKSNIDYTYWDDPNELVDRLRLLVASQQAGNNSHNNEIISIIEELREAGIIE